MANENKNNKKGNGQKFNWANLLITLIILIGVILIILWLNGVFQHKTTTKSYSEFLTQLKAGGVTSVHLNEYTGVIDVKDASGSYSVSAGQSAIAELTKAYHANGGNSTASPIDTNIISNIQKLGNHLSFASVPKAKFPWMSLILSLLPVILIIVLMVYMSRRAGNIGGSPFNGSKSAIRATSTHTKMSDVAGQEEVKEEVQEVIDFLKRPKKYKAAGAKVPKGILLAGPPGTGKTLIAKAVATEAGVPFFSMSASQFIEIFAGQGAKRVRELFKEARKASPSIIFIDELDAIGRKRGGSFGNDEREQTLNQILTEMDGMNTEGQGHVLVMAATNRPDVLDAALVRPGRFDRQIKVALPNVKERIAILELHAKGKRVSKSVNFEDIARRTPRFSGAQLAAIVNEAALLSVRESSSVITTEQIDEAIDRVIAGPAKKLRVISPEENRMVAVHEAGHAVVGILVNSASVVQKITIIPRGDAGGYNLVTPRQEKFNYTKSDFEGMIMGALGGRAAEQVIYGAGEVTTGASDDIKKATSYARSMVTQYGMSKLGPIAYETAVGPQYLGSTDRQREYSDALAERIDEAIREIVFEAEKKALALIKKNTKLLNLIVEELIDKETIVREEIEYIAENLKRLPVKEEVKAEEKQKSLDEILKEMETGSKEENVEESKEEETKETDK